MGWPAGRFRYLRCYFCHPLQTFWPSDQPGFCQTSIGAGKPKSRRRARMDILTAKNKRRSTRVRVEIPVTVTSLDRLRPFAEECVVLVASPQGCGFRSPRMLPLETPILLSGLPEEGTVTARVANCLPLGSDGHFFLIGAALYTHGNVWKIANPPRDWDTDLDCSADWPTGARRRGQFPSAVVLHPVRK